MRHRASPCGSGSRLVSLSIPLCFILSLHTWEVSPIEHVSHSTQSSRSMQGFPFSNILVEVTTFPFPMGLQFLPASVSPAP